MNPVGVIEGRMVPLWRADVDTDQIMPKQFLKRIERTGYGEFVFYDWRQEGDFVLDDPRYAGAKILVTGANFGCGSSREHAPWGLQQWGFEAIVAPSFADIFRINCAKTGLLCVELPAESCQQLAGLATEDPATVARIDLPAETVSAPDLEASFVIDPHIKRCMIEGLDDIGLTLRRDAEVARFEQRRPSWLPTAV